MKLRRSFETILVGGILGLIVLSSFTGAAEPAADPQGLASELAQVADRMSQYFTNLKSCEFRVNQETTTLKTLERFSETLFYTGSGEFYKYDYSDGRPEFTFQAAFNGEYGETLYQDSGMLHLKKGKQMVDDDAENCPRRTPAFFLLQCGPI